MKQTFRVTPRAFEDLKNIGRYTLRQWGRQQRDAYLRGLFARLAKQPMLGRARDDVAPGYRSCRHEAHIIFYLIRPGGIDIIGVLHQAMDFAHYFDSDAE